MLYCASDLDNKQLVELIENGSTPTGDCARCIELQSELDKCAQQRERPKIEVHNKESISAQKPAFTPNYVKNGVDLNALKAIASGQKIAPVVEPVQDEIEISVPKMGNAMAQGLVNQFAELIRRGCPDWACRDAITVMKDNM